MKRTFTFFFCFAMLVLSGLKTQAQGVLQSVTVETYYIADDQDIQDAPDQDDLPEGSVTYRVFVELSEGAMLRAIYGDENHPFIIESSEVFFNNSDRGVTYSWNLPDNRFDEYTVALDSWLSFGAASDAHWGIQKSLDPDGSFIGGANHENGWLVNEEAAMGIPLTTADGMIPALLTDPVNFVAVGDNPADIFDDATNGTSFSSTNFKMQQTAVELPETNNVVCIAQLTTAGDLSFSINLEVLDAEGNVLKFVSSENNLQENELFSPFLRYPLQCGCTDADFLEYSPAAGCDDGSCATPIIFGCNDPAACNYNPEVNLNIPELCCILPDNCSGLDQEALCPGAVNIDEAVELLENITVFPNPFSDQITINTERLFAGKSIRLELLNAQGELLFMDHVQAGAQHLVKLQNWSSGLYLLRVHYEGKTAIHRLIKQ